MKEIKVCPVCQHTEVILSKPIVVVQDDEGALNYILNVCANCGCMYNNEVITVVKEDKVLIKEV